MSRGEGLTESSVWEAQPARRCGQGGKGRGIGWGGKEKLHSLHDLDLYYWTLCFVVLYFIVFVCLFVGAR
jgi:hypothetical protein